MTTRLPSPVSIQARFCLAFATLLSVGTTGCGGRAGGVNIWDAVRADDAAKVAKYAQAGGDLNIQKWNGTTPLFVALSEEKRQSYEKLLELGADPNIIAKDGRVVVNYAAAEEDPFWLRLALEHGGDPNLLNVGASPHRKSTPLFFAIGTGSLENVKLLVKHGANLDAPDEFGTTPLVEALQCGRFDVVYCLLKEGADYTLSVPDSLHRSFLSEVKAKSRIIGSNRIPEQRQQFEAVREWLKEKGADLGD